MPTARASSADFRFSRRRTEQLSEPDRHFALTADEIRLMNPNTGTCPIFRSKRDAEINKAIYRRVPVLIREGDPQEPLGNQLPADARHGQRLRPFRTREQLEAEGWMLSGNIFHRGDGRTCPCTKRRWSTILTIGSAHTRARPNPRPTRASSRSSTRPSTPTPTV